MLACGEARAVVLYVTPLQGHPATLHRQLIAIAAAPGVLCILRHTCRTRLSTQVRQNPEVMAQKTVVLLEDDIDGGPADETITFALDGVSYEIDLKACNAARLREVFAPYVGVARRVGRPSFPRREPTAAARPPAGAPARSDPAQLAAIRAWARARGIPVNDRGRIPAHIIEQYNAPAAAPPAQVTFSAPASPQPAAPQRQRRR